MNLLEELETRIVCGDGTMGTLLLDRAVPVDRFLLENESLDAMLAKTLGV